MNIKPGLSSLLSPSTVDDFLNGHWPHRVFVTHGHIDIVKYFDDGLPLGSLDALLAKWPHQVQAHLPDVSDESSSLTVASQDAKKLFKNQMSLLFNHAERLHPLLAEWIHEIKAELGLPAMTFGRAMIYATPDGRGTACHFDQNINFVLQLKGTKRWWLAENTHVIAPTERHTLGLELDTELKTYARQPLPTQMPNNKIEVVLEPGSFLFVPRGYWHQTEAAGEALALNFTFNQPTWADLLIAALRSRLLMSQDWRELADGVSSADLKCRQLARDKFERLIFELTHDLDHWEAADILGATEGKSYDQN